MLAFLIADIRGYTHFTQEHGDEAAGRLAGKFATLTRDVVEGGGGTLLELRGDEALVVFDSARLAVRAAVALQQRLVSETQLDPTLPLAVGIGIDVGEVVPVEGGYRGRALTLAARLCSAAAAGEVLASVQIVHLAGRVADFRYVDRPALTFKGVDQPVAAVQVMPLGEDPAQQLRALGVVAPKKKVKQGPSRRRLAAVIAFGVVAALGLSATLTLTVFNHERGRSYRTGTVLLDLATGRQTGFVPRSELTSPGFPLYDGKHFWVLNATPSSFAEIDPHTGKVLTQFAAVTSASHSDTLTYQPYTVVGTSLWVGDGDDLVKMDTRLGREVDRYHLDHIVGGPGLTEGVTHGDGLLWVSRDVGEGQVVGLDPRTGAVRHRFNNVRNHSDIAYGDGMIWAADYSGFDVINVATGVVTTVPGVDGTNRIVQFGSGFGWTTVAGKGLVYKIDRDARVAATYKTGLGASMASYSDGTVWAANYDEGTATGVDAITGAKTTLRFGHPDATQAVGGGVLLAWLQPGKPIDTRIEDLRGDVLRLFAQQGELGDGDEPATNWSLGAGQIGFATCAKLLNYPDRSGHLGLRLEPEVAAAMPTLSRDRRTYTFTVRPGYRFSPPTNQPLTAETFRYSIERALSPKLGANRPGPFYVTDIAGERPYRAGKADHISGLRVQGNKLMVTLTKPSPDFLHRLALPFFCPVPTDTPFVAGAPVQGADAFVGGGSLPSAGPYYVATYINEELVVLKRNPNYTGPRPHALDAIALREGVDAGVALERVQNGSFDGIVSSGRNGALSPYDPLLAPDGAVAARYDTTASGRPVYVAAAQSGTGFLALNAGRGPFRDATVRRAAALALDRSAIAGIWQSQPSADLLPPTLPGFSDRPVSKPDPTAARALLRGRKPAVTMATFNGCTPCDAEATAVRAELHAAGFTVRIKRIDSFDTVLDPTAGIDAFDSGAELRYPDPASFLGQALSSLPPTWLPAGVRSRLSSLATTTGRHRTTAASALAAKLATSTVPVIAYGAEVQPEVFRSTVGCRTFLPASFGVDLAALCRGNN
jgi:ABC-type transport system substrate-binding protein/class 3 adenylate cyclase